MRYLLLIVLLMFGAGSAASEKSYSVTVKPGARIVGTVSFNIQTDGNVTVLIYQSATEISESPVEINAEKTTGVGRLIEETLAEYLEQKDYSILPEYGQTSSISITQDKFTKSISTRRYSGRLKELIKIINQYIPGEYRIQLESK